MTSFLDLFSGIGGFALGAEWAGLSFDAHYYSEVDDYAISVYQRRFPGAIALGDIRSIRGADLPAGDWIIAGGFPCQDISVAGKGAGLEGERSGLWYEYARLIGELRPRYAIMENVGALAFRGLDSVLGSLAALGYDAEWQDIRASDVGAPHRRERIWIVAYPMRDRRDERRPECARQFRGTTSFGASDVAHPSSKGFSLGGRSQWPEGNAEASAGMGPESERCGEDVADAMRPRLVPGAQGGVCGEKEGPGPRDEQSKRCGQALADAPNGWNVRRDGELEPAQGQVREHRGSPSHGRREWWAAEPDVGRVAHGIPSRVDRLKCLGNSIVPQIAEMIFSQSAFDEWRRQ